MVIVQGQGTMNEGKIQFNQAEVFLIDEHTSIDFQSNNELLAYRAYSPI
jgi:hypothetical protein